MPNLYHGTGVLFDEFSSSALKTGDGSNSFLPAFYLTSSFDLASYYAESNKKNIFCFSDDGYLLDASPKNNNRKKGYGGVVMDVFVNGSSRVIDGESPFSLGDAKSFLLRYMESEGLLNEVYGLVDDFFSDERFSADIDSDYFDGFFGRLVFVSNGDFLKKEFLCVLDEIADDALCYGTGDFDKDVFFELACNIFDKCVGIGGGRGVFNSYDISELMKDNVSDEPSWLDAISVFFSNEICSEPARFMEIMRKIGVDGLFVNEIAIAGVSGDCYMFFDPSVLNIQSILEPVYAEKVRRCSLAEFNL